MQDRSSESVLKLHIKYNLERNKTQTFANQLYCTKILGLSIKFFLLNFQSGRAKIISRPKYTKPPPFAIAHKAKKGMEKK